MLPQKIHFKTWVSLKISPSKNTFQNIGELKNCALKKCVPKNVLIINIIGNLNVNKAHGHDDISIRMIKMCDESLVRPLSIIFRNSLNFCICPSTWKKANVTPVHKKDGKQYVNNYCPVSLLQVFGKIFEKLIFNEICSFLDRNQSGFWPSDSCVNQLLIITHEIFSSFDCNPSLEVRTIFLDISKAFDKV